MNSNMISRMICLLLVLSLLVGISPIQAEASGITAAVAAFLASDAAPVIGSILVALGVTAVANSTHVFDTLASDCLNWLSETTSYIVDGGVWLAEYTYNGVKQLFAPEGLVQSIRDFLFSTGVLLAADVISGASIQAITCISGYQLSYPFRRLYNDSPENTLALVKNLGVNDKVFIYGLFADTMRGIYFNQDGLLCKGVFTNPYGIVNASLFGVYSLSDVTLESYSFLGTDYYYTDYIFYSPEYASSYPGFVTMACSAFRWDGSLRSGSQWSGCYWPFVQKTAADADLNYNSSTDFGVLCPESNCYVIGTFTWDTVTYESVTTDFDLKLENVALSGTSIADGYAYWSAGAISVPGSVNIPNQEEEKKYLPIVPPGTMEEVYEMTQDEAQTNTATGNPVVDSETDRVTFTSLKDLLESIRDHFSNWFARLSLNVSNILDAVRNGFNALISAVANIPKLITALLRFLAEQLRGLGFIWELLQMLGAYLESLFGWMPEMMRAIVLSTFTIAGIYMLIGR